MGIIVPFNDDIQVQLVKQNTLLKLQPINLINCTKARFFKCSRLIVTKIFIYLERKKL